MFEGIVQGLGRVTAVHDDANRRRLRIDLGGIIDSVALGGSVAVNGVCLTSTGCEGTVHTFDVIAETMARTNLSRLRLDDRVNIELPLHLGSPINGHLVSGHVDAEATITEVTRNDHDVRMSVLLPASLTGLVVMKGSIAIDGISLTVASLDAVTRQLSVALIPYTLEVTTLGFRQRGDAVNIEVDAQLRLEQAAFASRFSDLEARIRSLEQRLENSVAMGEKISARCSL